MNYHPDDQAEIDRLHSAFITEDEPNNEQVMAFQDASYALGLKRGQAHEAALQQRLNEADQHLDNATAVLRAVYNRGHVSHYGMTKIEDFFSQLTKDGSEVCAKCRGKGSFLISTVCGQARKACGCTDSPEVGS